MDDHEHDDGQAEGDEEELDAQRARELILARRNRFVAAALAGVAASACAKSSGPQVCLSPPLPTDAGVDASGPQVCLSPPQACLSEPMPDAGPMVCLSILPEDAGPSVCLDIDVDAGANADGGEQQDAGGPPPGVCLSLPAPED